MRSIWANSLVKNEERYLWYAVGSVIDFVDRVLLWDTGSSDNTLKIIKEIQNKYPSKIDFKEIGEVTPESYTEARQKMLEETHSDWFLVLDGDEVWWEDSIKKATDFIREKGEGLDSIVIPMVYPIGDIYHYQEEAAGKYRIDGRTGHLAVKFINRSIPGLYTAKPHGQHGYYDENNILIQDRSSKKRRFVEAPFMHFTHMIRSTGLIQDRLVPKRDIKYKYELGRTFPKDYYYPEAFFRTRPSYVLSPWETMDTRFLVRGLIETPLRKLKRRLYFGRAGY
jgi:glycosyltransferase involved in cell wall biosynthesis